MTVFLHELKANRNSTLKWAIALVAISVFYLSVFSVYTSGAEDIKKMLTGFPPEVLKALGMDAELLFSILGFYSFVFTYVVLCGAIQAMVLGTNLISKEFNRKTADFLFTKPISRTEILTGKLLAGLVSLLITDVAAIAAGYLMASAVSDKPFSTGLFFMVSITLFFVQMMFYTFGVLLGAIFHRIKSVLGLSLGTVFGFFIAGMLASILEEEKLNYVVPFKYYDSIKILHQSTYDSTSVALNIIFVVAAIAASYILYTKKDIHAV